MADDKKVMALLQWMNDEIVRLKDEHGPDSVVRQAGHAIIEEQIRQTAERHPNFVLTEEGYAFVTDLVASLAAHEREGMESDRALGKVQALTEVGAKIHELDL